MHFEKAFALFREGRFAELVRLPIPAETADYRVFILKSAAHAELGDFASAITALEFSSPEPQAAVAVEVTRSNIHILAGQFPAALAAAMRALRLYPGRSEALINAATALICMHDNAAAKVLLENQTRALNAVEQAYLSLAAFGLEPTGQHLEDLRKDTAKAGDVACSVMVANRLMADGHIEHGLEVLGPHRAASALASETYAEGLVRTGSLAAADDFVSLPGASLAARAEVACALRDQEQIRAVAAVQQPGPKAFGLLYRESQMPGARNRAPVPSGAAILTKRIIDAGQSPRPVDELVDVMECVLANTQELSCSNILMPLRDRLGEPEHTKLRDAINRLADAGIITPSDAQWCDYKLDMLSGRIDSAWHKLVRFKSSMSRGIVVSQPVLPEKPAPIEVGMPLILVFGMSRSGKSLLAMEIAKAMPHYMLLDELRIPPVSGDKRVLRENLTLLARLHPRGVILTVPHPREQDYLGLCGSADTKSVLVLRDENDLAFRIFEKSYRARQAHAYAYSPADCMNRVRWYQRHMPELLQKQCNSFLIQHEDFTSAERMAELAGHIGAPGGIRPLAYSDKGSSAAFRAAMDGALKTTR